MKTHNTNVVVDKTIELIQRYNLNPEKVHIDRGAGLAIADTIRRLGYNVQTVAFGESATEHKTFKRRWKSGEERREVIETRTSYKNRRTEMYHVTSQKINPNYGGFGLPPITAGKQYAELYRQLKVMPKLTDEEGRYYMPSKNPRPGSRNKGQSIVEILGNSPDEADALVLGVWGMERKDQTIYV